MSAGSPTRGALGPKGGAFPVHGARLWRAKLVGHFLGGGRLGGGLGPPGPPAHLPAGILAEKTPSSAEEPGRVIVALD